MANYRKSFNLRNGVQVDDDNFIVNPNGLVGIGTTIPTEFLDVRGNAKVVGLVTANTLYAGIATVGILSATQSVTVSGAVNATSFSGSASGLTGIYAIAVDGWYISGGNISTTSNVGVGTTNPQGALQIGVGATFSSTGNAAFSGIVTATSFDGSLNASNLTGTIDNARLPSNINVSGIITASSGFVGNLTGIASTAHSITTSANITVNSINSGFSTTGIATAFTELDVGVGGTAFTALNSGRIGIGTALPTSELQIRKESGSLLEVISNSGSARISVGQSVGVGKSTGVIRFGDTDRTLDIINNDTGNLNYYLHAGSAGVGTGRFDWLYGQTNAQLMSLTYGGSLGLGKTNPDNTLHVVGTSTVTGNAFFGNDVTINGALSATSLTLTSALNANLTGNVNGNVNASSGISTFRRIEAANDIVIVSSSSSIGIGTTQPIVALDARNKTGLFAGLGINTTTAPNAGLNVNGGFYASNVGIGTTLTNKILGVYGSVDLYPATNATGTSIYIYDGDVLGNGNSKVGMGTTAVRAAIDFADAGKTSGTGQISFMIVPRLSNIQRAGLSTVEGAFIFNTDSKKFQGYTGVAWTDFH